MLKGIMVFAALSCGLAFSQAVDSKLKGKRIYMHKNDGGHQGGYDGLKAWLENNKAAYGYEFEATGLNLSETALNTLFGRLYKGPDSPRQPNTIDILIFCQGEGDGNMGRGPFPPSVSVGNIQRHTMVNTHVKAGGVLILVHAAAGREISYWKWGFGAMLMGSWFLDNCFASPQVAGNSGHFGANTVATATLDEETLQAKDPSLFFIRNLFTQPKDKGGLGQPLINSAVKGEWYHFNGNFKYEDGSGGAITNPQHTSPMVMVRGNAGFPDSGIGPTKIITTLTRINSGSGYNPPGKGRPVAWAREVSWEKFNPATPDKNGRFIYTNAGHDGDEWTTAGQWMGSQFLAMLRWSVKDERGCMDPNQPSLYKPFATVYDGSCPPVGIGGSIPLKSGRAWLVGRVAAANATIDVTIDRDASHSVRIADMKGRSVYEASGTGRSSYQVPGLDKGSYIVRVDADGKSVRQRVTIR